VAQLDLGFSRDSFAAPARPLYRARLMSARRLAETFDAWRRSGEPLVLATVFETQGSTYSKAGHSILISGSGDYQGLVSGGCLEGDLAERARKAIAARRAVPVMYDLRDDADELWGLGIGCNGLIKIFLQPLYAAEGYEPFATIAQCMTSHAAAAVATVIESPHADLVAGATLVRHDGQSKACNVPPAWTARLAARCDHVLETGRAKFELAANLGVLCAPIKRVPRLLVLGAGLDAIPLVRLAADLGWTVTVADHRPAYTQRPGLEAATAVLTLAAAEISKTLALDEFDAIIVMSHHLATDQTYLAQLGAVRARYIGVLGPPARKQRLLNALPDRGAALRAKLKGPVGLDIRADSPESIALSIVAELQATFAEQR
jgi:xanthine/CO dehydrogenase XdhC/CoxF family maturation factor